MKRIFIAALTLALVFSLAACAGAGTSADTDETAEAAETDAAVSDEATAETDTSWADIEAKGYFILGFDQTFAPMGFKGDDGEYVGFDVDLATEVANRLGLELRFQPVDWESKEMELASGNIDVIWNGLTITEERREDMLFSDPYMNNRQIIVVAANSGITSIADLAGKTVAAQIDSSAMSAIEAQPEVMNSFGSLIDSPDYVEALMELKQGTVDAVVVDETMGSYYINEDDDPDAYVILEENFGEEQYGIGFRLGEQAFRDKIQETLDAIIADGTGAQFAKKWFGYDVLVTD